MRKALLPGLLGQANASFFFLGFRVQKRSHWIRVEIPCKTAVVSRPELRRRPDSWQKMYFGHISKNKVLNLISNAGFSRFCSRTGSPRELRTRNYRGFTWNFDPNPMGPVPDPKSIKKDQNGSKILKDFFYQPDRQLVLHPSHNRYSYLSP